MALQVLTNAKNLATRQRLRASNVDAALKAQARKYGEETKNRAIGLSQGGISAKAQRGYHPGIYSTQRAAQPLFDAIINKQSGLFASSWRLGVYGFAGHVTVTVYNTAPYARFMQGTDKMRRRGILDAATLQKKLWTQGLREAKRLAELRMPKQAVVMAVIVSSPGSGAGSSAGGRSFASTVSGAPSAPGFGSLGADLLGVAYSVGSSYLSAAMNS